MSRARTQAEYKGTIEHRGVEFDVYHKIIERFGKKMCQVFYIKDICEKPISFVTEIGDIQLKDPYACLKIHISLLPLKVKFDNDGIGGHVYRDDQGERLQGCDEYSFRILQPIGEREIRVDLWYLDNFDTVKRQRAFWIKAEWEKNREECILSMLPQAN